MNIIETAAYAIRKQAMPLPMNVGTPTERQKGGGLEEVDNSMSQQTADQMTQQHGNHSYLGAGADGVAFGIADNKAVKYTYEYDDAMAYKAVMTKQSPCLNKVYEVTQVQQEPPIWKIVSDKLRVLPQEEQDFVDELLAAAWNSSDTGFKLPTAKYLGLEEDWQLFVYKKYAAFLACLRKAEVSPGDAKGCNLGYGASGQYVLLDFGGSQPIAGTHGKSGQAV